MRIFQKADCDVEYYEGACLAFADPVRMRPKEEETFLGMRSDLPAGHTARNQG